MAQIWEYIKIAFMNIKSNKGRSILTMLGIIIGISSVIMIISIGNTIKVGINDNLDSMVNGQINIYSSGENEDGIYVEFDDSDLEAIMEEVNHIKAVTPTWVTYGQIGARKGSELASINCGSSALQYSKKEPIVKGRYFSDSDYYAAKKVCVIDEYTATKLYGNTNIIGMTVDVTLWDDAEEFTIVGIRQNSESGMIAGLDMQMLTIDIPYTTIGSSFGVYLDTFSDLLVFSEGPEYATQVAKDTVRLLENRHNVRGKNVIQLIDYNDLMSEITGILDYITVFVVLVASISLLVGGIGVMNIMLVSVTERTREIGIRKALGARTGSILLQFLSESAIISLIGGVIGILLGIFGAACVCALVGSAIGELTLQIKASTVLGASIFSMAVGIFFGIYPAQKAAKLSPIEALRHE